MKYKFILCAVLWAMCHGIVFADYTPLNWMYEKSVTGMGPEQSGQYVKVHIDREVDVHAKPDLSDVRLLENGVEAPYQLVTLSETVRAEYLPSTMFDLSSVGETSMFILDLGAEGVLHDHLRVLTDSKNFKRNVAVYAADTKLSIEDTKWRLLTDKGYVYNFHDNTSGFDAGSGEINFPPTSSRYLKVVILRGEGQYAVLRALVLRLTNETSTEKTLHETATVFQNLERKTTEITVDLGGAGIPTHSLTLATNETKNFNRRALVLGSNNGEQWTSLGGGYIFLLNTSLFSGNSLMLSYPETQFRYIRVLVMNQDDAPLAWSDTILLESTVRAAVFLVRGGMEYKLLYGNMSAVSPSYDIARFFQYIESNTLTKVELGREMMNSSYMPPKPPQVPYSEEHPRILTAVLVLLVAVLSFLLLSYLKKIKNNPRGQNQ